MPFPKRYRQYKLMGNDDYTNLKTIVTKRMNLGEKSETDVSKNLIQ
jgi:excinuclease UvrABC nuclease subunit